MSPDIRLCKVTAEAGFAFSAMWDDNNSSTGWAGGDITRDDETVL